MIQRSYKVEIDPTEYQARELARHIGVSRWVYNWTLAQRQERWRHGGRVGKELNRELTGRVKHLELPAWISDVAAVVRREAQVDVDAAYQKAFDRLKKGSRGKKIGWPRFRNRNHTRYWYSVSGGGRCDLILGGNRDYVGMVGITGPVRVKERGYLPDRVNKICSCAYSLVAGRHYLSVTCEVEDPGNRGTHVLGEVGIDCGSKTALVLSDGRKYKAPRPLVCAEQKLRRAQRSVARKYEARKDRNGQIGSKAKGPVGSTEKKARDRVAKIHAEISRIRRDWQQKVTTDLIKHYRVIRIEDLLLTAMTASAKGTAETPGANVKQKAGFNRRILDVGIGEILRELEYKGKWYGCTVERVDRYFPSTQLCSVCGAKTGPRGRDQLGVRRWVCGICGTTHDRDHNAAVNIRDFPRWSKASDGSWRRDAASETPGRPGTERPCRLDGKAEHMGSGSRVAADLSPLAAEGTPGLSRGESTQVGAVDDRRASPVDRRCPPTRKGGIAISILIGERLGGEETTAPARVMTEQPGGSGRQEDSVKDSDQILAAVTAREQATNKQEIGCFGGVQS